MSDGSRHSMSLVLESTYGTTPATPEMTPIRNTGTTLGLSKNSLQSGELRDDRQIADFRHGAKQTGGGVDFELSYRSHDVILEALLGGTWVPASTTGQATLAGTATSFTRSSGSFIDDGIESDKPFIASGFDDPGLNGVFMAGTVTALAVPATPLEGQTMVVEAAAAARQLDSEEAVLKAGTTRRSFTIERYFSDIDSGDNPYHRFTGSEFNTLSLAIASDAMITGSFGVVGKGLATAGAILSGETYKAASTTSPVDSFTGSLNENGGAQAVVTEISLELDNGLAPRFVVGSNETILPSIGRSNVTGSVTAFFENATMLDKFINETESSIDFEMPDGAGNILKVTLPRIKYSGGQPDVSGEGPITLAMPFQALLDSTSGTNIQIDRTPA
jgi:hypothetical protein